MMRCEISIWKILPLVLAIALLSALPLRLQGAQPESLEGVFRDDRLVLELTRSTQASANYSGTIRLGEQTFQLKAEAAEGRLQGTFESEGDEFSFTATLDGRTLIFTTDGTTYRLKRESLNPLAHPPSRPNPLARSDGDNAASAPRPSSVSATNLSTKFLHLKRNSVMDDPAMIGGEALSLLAPLGWQVEGGVTWRMHPSAPACVAMRVSNSNRTELVEVFPTYSFVWTEGGIPLFPAGSIYKGNQVAEPIEDPTVYIRQVIGPRFRQHVTSVQVISTEELPTLAEAIGDFAPEPGSQKKCRASRMRFEYVENGRAMEEDIYCVLVSVYTPAIRTTYWGPERNYSFKAEKGKLEGKANILQTIVSSFRSNLKWFNRYVQLLQAVAQNPIDTTRPVAELSQYLPRTNDTISEGSRQLYDRQQTSQDRINLKFLPSVRRVGQFRNPFDSRLMFLPSEFPFVWTNPLGEIVLGDDPEFGRTIHSGQPWRKAERMQ